MNVKTLLSWCCRRGGLNVSLTWSSSLQVRAHQLVLPPCEVVIKAVSEYVSAIKDLGNLDAIARDVFKQSQVGPASRRRFFLP